jgi:DNA-directed RNA polymerase specialized sigma24 family protein
LDGFDAERRDDARASCGPETLPLHTEDVSLVEQAMKSLPVRSCELLVLHELAGLSELELVAMLGIPAGIVTSSLSRARRAYCHAMDTLRKENGFVRG